VCFEPLRNVFVSSDNQFRFLRGLSSSRALYNVKSVVSEYCGIVYIPMDRELIPHLLVVVVLVVGATLFTKA